MKGAGGVAVLLALAGTAAAAERLPPAPAFPVAIAVDASHPGAPLQPLWRFFGADEPNYATHPDGRKLLGDLGALRPGEVFFRTHNLLTTGDGTPALKWGSTNAYTEDAAGRPIYDWTILDQIFDTYRTQGVKPYVEIGFMPEALSRHPEPYRHHWTPTANYNEIYTGWAYPPKDYARWGELVRQWAAHCLARYGRPEVDRWYWEVWNESNNGYWKGTPEEFRRLHDFAVAGVRRAIPEAKVGGADTAGPGGQFTRDFLAHCLHGTNYATGQPGTPLDFVSFHAKGSPVFVDGHVRMGLSNQLRALDAGCAIVASYPELKSTPIIVGESDPDGCAACQGPKLGYRNGTLYASYTAASIAREYEIAARRGVNLEGTLTWAFEFEDQPWFAGFRVLATHGVVLPVFNVFRMLSQLDGRRVATVSSSAVPLDRILRDGVRGQPDVGALASLAPGRLAVLVWHYHDDDVPGPAAAVALTLAGLPAAGSPLRVRHYRIDATHSNAFTVWQGLGSPAAPTAEEARRLAEASQLAALAAPALESASAETATVRFALPRQAVSLLLFEWEPGRLAANQFEPRRQ